MTLRDDTWNAVLVQLRKTGQFKISDLPFDENKRHTVRRVLREMETLGWLDRDNDRAAIWKLGELGKLHLNINPDKHDP
jgi:hypothetical protein